MSRIKKAFSKAKIDGKAFIPFVTAGDPDLDATVQILLALAKHGATVIELGVPFSDPMADGPVIQASSQRSIANHGTSIDDVLEIVAEFRKASDVPLVLFGYLNPFFVYGINRLSKEASAAGADGFLITDVIDGEFRALSRQFEADGLDLITLIAPTTPEKRLETVLQDARGFVYAISNAGVTGNRKTIGEQAQSLVMRARRYTDLPIVVGFGIADRETLESVLAYADAAVVGSALVKRLEGAETSAACVERVRDFARDFELGG